MKKNIIIYLATAFLAAVSVSCSVDETDIYGSFPYLEIDFDSATVTKVASTESYPIKTNRKVTASVASEQGTWLSAAVEGEQLVLSWMNNELETTREATVTLSTTNSLVTRTFKVVQDASGELTVKGDLILRSKEGVKSNTYTKTTGNLILGDVVSVKSKATSSSITAGLRGTEYTVSPSDISDSDIDLLKDQIHMIGGKGLAVVNTDMTTLPVDVITSNGVSYVSFVGNKMTRLPSAEVMKSLKLKELSIKGNDITDVSPLLGCTTIEVLDISGNDIYDIEPLLEVSANREIIMHDLPISAPKLEILLEKYPNHDIVSDDVRPEDSPLPLLGELIVTPVSDTQVHLQVPVDANLTDISKVGFYIGNKRKLSEMSFHEAEYSDGVITMTYDVETLENIIYYVRAYAENSKGGDYSKCGFFGSLTAEEDVYIKSHDELEKFYDDTYSHVNGSVFVGNTTTSGTSGVKLDDGKYSMYFRSTDMSDLSLLKSLVYVRDGLYIGNVGLSKLDYISHIEGMKTLWLRGNEISRIPLLECAETVTYLDVSMNDLENLDFVGKFPLLESLYLGSSDFPETETNDIGLIEELADYQNLKFIDLSGLPLHQWQVDDLMEQMPETEIVFTSAGRDPHIPTVRANRTSRGDASVTINGAVTSKGKYDIVEYGFYYGKNLASLNKVKVGESIGEGEMFSYNVQVSDLDVYYWYPYAVNASGESRCDYNEFTLAYEDLSQTGTANCYLIHAPGKYKFKATVRGNSVESVGAPVEASVVWEFNDIFEQAPIISSVSFVDDYVEFEVREDAQYGNALIAVYDANDTILWSWHIWLCDFDPEASAHSACNDVKLMDRNLGATLSEFSDHESRIRASGLLYQWGRKDPISQVTVTHIRGAFGSVEESFAQPTWFATEWSWVFPENGIRGLWSPDQKTKYDPCPPGWKVADMNSWEKLEVYDMNEFGVKIKYSSGSNTVQYPFNLWYDQGFNYIEGCWEGHIWTSELPQGEYWYPFNFAYFSGGGYNYGETRTSSDALAVRCMKDNGLFVTTLEARPGTDKVTVSGNVASEGLSQVSERGFVLCYDYSEPNLDNTKVVSGSGTGDFSAVFENLDADTVYSVRAYAIGDGAVRYGNVLQFRTAKGATGGDDFTEDDYVWE